MIQRLLHWLRQLFVLPIRIYQGTLSRITPATCRFKPTCSQYTVESVENRGILIGSLYSCWRILRCNPFSDGGWDLPPAPRGQGRRPSATERSSMQNEEAHAPGNECQGSGAECVHDHAEPSEPAN